MLDETAKRLPGFNEDESVPVTFGDDQDWYLPRPTFDIFATFSGGKAAREVSCSFGPEFQALLKAVQDSDDDFFPAVATLAADLLRRNYDISDDELPSLLRYRVGPDRPLWIGGVLSVANGNDAPKASGDGSGSSSDT